jgi:TonB family protein
MVPKRWPLIFTFVAALALVILYIRNNGPEPPRPVPQPQIPTSKPEVAPPLKSEAAKAAPPSKPVFGAPILGDDFYVNQLVRMVRPQYTKAALNAHYEGQVKVNFILGRDGVAHKIQIVNSPGYGMDQNIIEAMKQWLWDSAFIHEDQKVTITIVFKLDH